MSFSDMTLASALEGRGIRMTRQRRILLDLIENVTGHVSASRLLDMAQRQDASINRATVYRTLALLKEHGLVDELDLMHLEGHEHFYERRKPEEHVHVGCRKCGRIVEMETDLLAELGREIRRKTGFMPDSMRIEVRALCAHCRTE